MAVGQKGWATKGIKSFKDFFFDYEFYFSKSSPRIRATETEFLKILRVFFRIVMIKIIERGVVFWFGANIGTIRIAKKKVDFNRLARDYGTYNKTGEKVGFINANEGFFKYSFHWDKRFCSLKNQSMTSFTATKIWKRHLAKVIQDPARNFDYEIVNKAAL